MIDLIVRVRVSFNNHEIVKAKELPSPKHIQESTEYAINEAVGFLESRLKDYGINGAYIKLETHFERRTHVDY